MRRTFFRLSTILLLLLLAGQATAAGGLYKWVDKDGNVHYSDQPPPEDVQEDSVEMMDVDDGYGVKQVANRRALSALPNPPTLVFKSMDLRLSKTESTDVTIGRLFYGTECDSMIDLRWDEGFLEYDPKAVGSVIGKRFESAGYRFSTLAPGFGHLGLSATIVSLRVDACARNPRGNGAQNMHGSVYLKVAWRLMDGTGRVLFRESSEGAHHGMSNRKRIDKSYLRALEHSATNLLASEAFRDSVNQVRDLTEMQTDVALSSADSVTVSFGDGNSEFVGLATELLAASVTIRLENGHGSGVFVGKNTILTNAHVVGEHSEVTIITDRGESRGIVIARNANRDVALVKTESDVKPVQISRKKPHPGEPLFVIGTPLDESLSHTVTKGILSAERSVDGLRYYQTDASINRGNSGGPVLDASGELVGISVAGIFTRDGAGMNVNYVIPIRSALKTLGISTE